MQKIKAAVIGTPISHSLSPKLHNYWLEKLGINGGYEALEIKKDNLKNFLENFSSSGLKGINITVPHKEKAYEIVKKIGNVSKFAEKVGAINTLYLKNGEFFADNTDYYGFKNSLYQQSKNFSFKEKNILIIGAGGAAKAIIAGLLDEQVNKIYLANRTLEKAQKYQEKAQDKIIAANMDDLEDLINESNLIVNCTSCGLAGKNDLEIDFSQVKNKKIFYDIVYNPLITKFLKDAKNNGHEIVTGIGMLLYQAVPAFSYFFEAETEVDKGLEQYILQEF